METHDQVLLALRRIMRAIDLRSRELMQKSGLTGPQLLVLQALARCEGATVTALTAQVNLSQGTVTSILDRLEQKGLVQRARSELDKRKVLLTLTETGRQRLVGAPSLLHTHFIDSFRHLKDWEQTLLLSSLQRLAEMMDAPALEAAPLLEEPWPESEAGHTGDTPTH